MKRIIFLSASLCVALCWVLLVFFGASPDSETLAVTDAPSVNAGVSEVLPKLDATFDQQTEAEVARGSIDSDSGSGIADGDKNLDEDSGEELIHVSAQLRTLRLEDGLSDFNLLVLKEVGLGGLAYQSSLEWTSMPEEMKETLRAFSKLSQIERQVFEGWRQGKLEDLITVSESLAQQRRVILGEHLFERLYAPDDIEVAEDGYSGEYRQDLLEVPSGEQNNEPREKSTGLTESVNYEQQWQDKLNNFLNAYQYVERAGLEGDDEQQMRRELLAQYFEPDEFQSVNQFLFGDGTGSMAVYSEDKAEL